MRDKKSFMGDIANSKVWHDDEFIYVIRGIPICGMKQAKDKTLDTR